MPLFTSHNIEAHIQWWNELDAKVCIRSNTRIVLKAFLYEYELHARVMGEDEGWWHASESHIAAVVGCKTRTIKSLLSSLKSSNIVSIKSSNSGSRIKINDYNKLFKIQKEKSSNESSNESSTKSSPNRLQNRIEEGLKEESKPISQGSVVVPAMVDSPNQPEKGFNPEENGKAGSDIPTECSDLYKRFNALVGPLSAQRGHVLKLHLLRKSGKLTDEQMFETVMNAAKKIRDAGDRDAYLLGVLKGAIERPGENGKSNFNCPEHGPMTRENWGGNIVYRCCKMVNGEKCPKHHRTGQTWTDQIQRWEPQNR